MVRSLISLILVAQGNIFGVSASPRASTNPSAALLRERAGYTSGSQSPSSSSSVSPAARRCYFPDGSSAFGNVPCNGGGGVSNCCASADACLANGLCLVNTSDGLAATLNKGVEFARGACTDPTWSAPECFGQCRTSQPGSPASNGAAVFECGSEGYAKGANYCCENGINAKTACCATPSLTFYLGPGTSSPAAPPPSSTSTTPAATTTAIATGTSTTTAARSTVSVTTNSSVGTSSMSTNPTSTSAVRTSTVTGQGNVTSTRTLSTNGPLATPLQAGASMLGSASTIMAIMAAMACLFS